MRLLDSYVNEVYLCLILPPSIIKSPAFCPQSLNPVCCGCAREMRIGALTRTHS